MRVFGQLVLFELRHYLRAVSTWIYWLVLAGASFFLVNALGGAFETVRAGVGGSDGNVLVNSPFVIFALTLPISLVGILVTAALAGHAGYRDFGEGMHPLVFTTPVGRLRYVAARYVGTILVNGLVFSGIGFGIWLASLMPYLEADQFGPNRLAAYVAPYLVLVLPNLAFTAAIFLGLALLTRQRLPHFIAGIVLFMGYQAAQVVAGDVENKRLASLLDPFGARAMSEITDYWTTVEKNTQLVPLDGPLLANRLIWLGVALAIFSVCVLRFRLTQHGLQRARQPVVEDAGDGLAPSHRLDMPSTTRSFGAAAHWAQLLSATRQALATVLKSPYFVAILLANVAFLIVGSFQVGKIYGTTTWPVTYQVIDVLASLSMLFVLIVVTVYGGQLVWRERDLKIAQLVDATPAPSWVAFVSKLGALAVVLACMMGVVFLTGVLTQLARGYTKLEPGLYAKSLLGMYLVDGLLYAVLALTVHSIVNHKYVGHFVVVAYYFVVDLQDWIGIEHALTKYASDAGKTYSDMNAFGGFLEPFVWYKFYWVGVALILALLSNLFWVRGQETLAAWRLRLAGLRLSRPASAYGLCALVLVLSAGGWIFFNTNVRNEYRTTKEQQERQAEYERTYSKYEGLPMPRIVSVSVEADLYPTEGHLATRGTLRLRNKTDAPLTAVHVRYLPEAEIRRLELGLPAEVVSDDEDMGYRIYELESPMAPGEETELAFDFWFEQTGFEHGTVNTDVVENGSFVHSYECVPGLGYDDGVELSQDRVRKKHGLEPKERMRDLDDPEGRKDTYISSDSDWVDFEALVSTSADQIAIAPGYLQEEWTEGDRRYFRYEMDAPILNFFSFLSARYVVVRDSWNDVAIEVYHHPGHEYNVQRMIDAVKKSLDYYTREFSPYQHRQVRILEFPRYASFAQSFPNTIPYSESIGFIAKVDEEDIDYPFYVTAHEVAHQWWAHQVIGADVQGSTLLSETLSQYSALMVMEKELGRDQIKRFLRYELDQYLSGRSLELKKELPLMRVENQQYIHYRKGSLVMYALKDAIGEEALNGALRRYIADVAFQDPPYTTSRELVSYLREATPPDLQHVIDDLFEHITLFENRAVDATYTPAPGGGYEVTLTVEAKKVRAGEQGEETQVELADLIDIGVFGEDEETLYLEKHPITDATREITVHVERAPETAGIDPYHVLVDRHPDDNTVRVTRVPGA